MGDVTHGLRDLIRRVKAAAPRDLIPTTWDATVVAVAPVMVVLGADTTATPQDADATWHHVTVGQQVRVELVGARLTIVATRAGAITLAGGVNLNAIISPGSYIQRSNANAASGINYPVAAAGLLIVDGTAAQGSGGDMIWQTYTTYASSLVASTLWRRGWHNGTWSTWEQIPPPGGVVIGGVTYPTSGRLTVNGVAITTASGGGFQGEAAFPNPLLSRPAGWAPVYQADYRTGSAWMVMLGSVRGLDAATVTALVWSPESATLDVPLSWTLRKTT